MQASRLLLGKDRQPQLLTAKLQKVEVESPKL